MLDYIILGLTLLGVIASFYRRKTGKKLWSYIQTGLMYIEVELMKYRDRKRQNAKKSET